MLPGVPVRTVEEVVAQAELLLLTVPDDDLAALVAGLTATRAWQAGQIVVHTSGSHGVGGVRRRRCRSTSSGWRCTR